MKNLFLLFAMALLAPVANAQDCSTSFALLKEGAEAHYKHFDGDDAPTMLVKTKLTELDEEAGVITATYESEWENLKKGKKKDEEEMLKKGTFEISCDKGVVTVSLESMLAPGTLENYKDMEIEINGTPLTIPEKLTVGQTLEDGDVSVSVKMNGMNIFTSTVTTSNRKVKSNEVITTAAGTFTCTRITYDTEVKMGFIKTKSRTEEWHAPGVGLIKSFNYDKRDKVTSATELVFLKK